MLRREGYRLRVSGLVARPVDLSIADLERLGKREQVTLHLCILGWTGVALWAGVTVRQLMDLVQPLPDRHNAPLRLRVENQLGYKMVKWIKSIEFVSSYAALGKGYGGKNEDDEYYPVVADI